MVADSRDGPPDEEGWVLAVLRLRGEGNIECAYRVAAVGLHTLQHRPPALVAVFMALLEDLAAGRGTQGQARATKAWTEPHTAPPGGLTRVLVISDLHVDQGNNMARLAVLSKQAFKDDVLVVAGDVADTLPAIKSTLGMLRAAFGRVVFVPGNHDLWLRPDTPDATAHADSICKLLALWAVCDDLGVDVCPIRVCSGEGTGGHSQHRAVVLPLLSWPHCSFDVRDPRPGRLRHDAFCTWPVNDCHALWQLMLALNRPALRTVAAFLVGAQPRVPGSAAGPSPDRGIPAAPAKPRLDLGCSRHQEVGHTQGPLPARAAQDSPTSRRAPTGLLPVQQQQQQPIIITFTHFLPSAALPFHANNALEMAKAMGCLQITDQLDAVGSHVHVHGHSHCPVDGGLPGRCLGPGGVHGGMVPAVRRHVHNPLDGNPRPSLVCVWDSRLGRAAAYHVDLATGSAITRV